MGPRPPATRSRRARGILRPLRTATALAAVVACGGSGRSPPADIPPPPAPIAREEAASEGSASAARFEDLCSSCHALDLATSLRLDRAGWEDVVRRMVEEQGATWIGGEERRILVDYLTGRYGAPGEGGP